MKFTVVWLPRAERELAELWEKSTNRSNLTLAADRLDQVLRTIPDRIGEECPDHRRVTFDPPLAVLYRVLLQDRIVRVISVWDITDR
jgi:plasmid stabilization system protein ParE